MHPYCVLAGEPTLALSGWKEICVPGCTSVRSIDADAARVPDLEAVENKHSVSGLLEKYFRELPQPVTTWAMYEDFMQAADEQYDDRGRVEYLKSVVDRLPEANQALLSYFLGLMKRISKHADVNKMGEKNLGVVFGSIILGPENLLLSLGDKKKLQNQSVVVGLLITHCPELFPETLGDLGGEGASSTADAGGGGDGDGSAW